MDRSDLLQLLQIATHEKTQQLMVHLHSKTSAQTLQSHPAQKVFPRLSHYHVPNL